MPVAIVTGAARGIGRAIALQLAEDGYDLTLNDIDRQATLLDGVKEEVEAKGRKCKTATGNVSIEDDVKALVKTAVDTFGELNVMIANAGIIKTTRLLETSVADLDEIYSVNVRGAFLCYREAARQMIAQGKGGKIVGAASVAAFKPSGNTLPYTATKHAVRGLTQASALDLAEYGINVNAYCPGPVGTDMWMAIDESIRARPGGEDMKAGDAFEASVKARSALKRASEPADIANLVSFLVSEKARNITGQSVLCDGGIHFS